MTKKFVLPAALLLALGATTALSAPGFAQAPATSAPAAPAQATPAPGQNLGPAPWDQQGNAQHPGPKHRAMQGQMGHRFDFTARAEARIAYVKAELKITPAQEAAFDKYAQVIRDNAAAAQKAFQDMRAHRGQTMSALDRVTQRAKFAQMRDQYQQQYLAAFKPLYASLSPDQKKVADNLATPHFRHFGHGGPRRG
ncbi:MAG TPA: Spy/CpxP family protein refolding chaperone [Stellaceae bacterium]|nr:Spy/CpxP family protein refolding chaperone [Stellaceae bacterium]